MSRWNERYIPYPLLAPWTSDYNENIDFGVKIPSSTRDDNDNINLAIHYELNSEYLKDLIAQRQAKYLTIIECNRTFSRIAQSPSLSENTDIFVKPASDFSDSLSLVPYIVSTCEIDGFLSNEHDAEIRYLNPSGFHIGPWSMLARGAEQQIELDANSNPNSVIDILSSEYIDDGAFVIDLNENRIRIYVSDKDYHLIARLRGNKTTIDPEVAALFPALYMYAVVEALQNLREHEHRRWHDTIRNALEKHSIGVDNDELRDNAIKYAQILMENPLGKMLKSFELGD